MKHSDVAIKFELDRLVSHKDSDLIAEIQRVALLIEKPFLIREEFDRHAKVNSYTVVKRFGGWREALGAAGLGNMYSGRRITQKMKTNTAKTLTDEELIAELQRVASHLDKTTLTMDELNTSSSLISDHVVRGRFGSWQKGLEKAGLALSNHGKRYTEDDYFENMLAVSVDPNLP